MTPIRLVILALVASITCSATNVATIAGWTTVLINADTIARLVRHPKRETKKVGKKVKDAVNGKN